MNHDDEFYGYFPAKCADLCNRIADTTTSYAVAHGSETFTNIIANDELIQDNEMKVYMSVPIIPLRCLCGCPNTFSLEQHNLILIVS
jgi:hypothetical protein